MALTLDLPLTALPGVGPARAAQLEKLGLRTAGDLLTFYPRGYEDRRQVYAVSAAPAGQKVCVQGMIAERPRLSRIRKGLELVKARAVDGSAALFLTFFNQCYVEKALKMGEEYVFYGVLEVQNGRRSMVNPVFEPAGRQDVTGRIMPVYPLTAGVSNYRMAGWAAAALPLAEGLSDSLPPAIRREYGLSAAEFAVRTIHRPPSFEELELARRRLTFEELFYLAVGLTFLKQRRSGGAPGAAVPGTDGGAFLSLLPFAPTAAQRRVMEEIAGDLASGRPTNRLVQGDVGSGKTAVAAFAAFLCARAGYQTALMAPTEVLAEQHARSLSALLAPAGVRVELLTGSLSPAEKKRVRRAAADGSAQIVVGTQALIAADTRYRSLALIVADEQHRFGVAQRAALAAKSGQDTPPHVLVMSATPIPRTLALMVYGDLDVSVIDQLPPGRAPVETYVIHEDKRQRMYAFVRRLVQEGRQVYIICPAVEEGEPGPDTGEPPMDLKAVKTYAAQLADKVFPDLTVGLLHGKLHPREKAAAMEEFTSGRTQVLVSTTVVEVGVDVPNAALIIIENAERFGLSQLHQLRGRVGRGKHQSYCVLMTKSRQEEAMKRLKTLAGTNDGFQIAQADLEQRGPGDFFGSRQHGLPQLRLASLTGDMDLLAQAQQAACGLLRADPDLSKPENAPVLARVRALFAETPDIFN